MTTEDKILKIEKDLGLSALGMAKLMGVSRGVYYNKKNTKIKDHCFNESNYNTLVTNLKEYIKKI